MLWRVAGPLVVAAATMLIRLPGIVSTMALSFDEGVYGTSVLAMRAGGAPFRDVFSSQGPLFLPLLWLADLAGPGHVTSLRLLMAATAVAVALGVYAVVSPLAGRGMATVAGAVTGLSGVVVEAAGPVQSDGIALAFSVWAVALALGRRRRWQPLAVGVLLGAAVAVKSIFAVPAVLAVVWLGRRRWRLLLVSAVIALAVVVGASLPWGIGNVWDQFVLFHLEVPRERNPATAVATLVSTLVSEEPMVLAMLGGGLLLGRWRTAGPDGDHAVDRGGVFAWLIATLLLLIVAVQLGEGFERYVAFLVPPLVASTALLHPPPAAVAVAVVAVLPFQLAWNDDVIWRRDRLPVHDEVIAMLRSLPRGAEVVTDRPALAWLAGRHPPGELVDPSWAQVVSGRVTGEMVVAAAERPEVCAVLFYTGRFDWIDRRLEDRLPGYRLVATWGQDRRLHVAERCLA